MSVLLPTVVLVFLILVVIAAVTAFAAASTRLPGVASAVSVLTIVVTIGWMVWTAVAEFGAESFTVTVPVEPMPPRLADGVTLVPPVATIRSGGFDQLTVAASGLSVATRLTILAGVLVAGATMIGVSLVIGKLARSLSDGDPFQLSGDALTRTAWIVMIGGIAATVINDAGVWMASNELLTVNGWTADRADGGDVDDLAQWGWPNAAPFVGHLPFWPLGAALVLALLAAVFRYGQKLKRDAEGLV